MLVGPRLGAVYLRCRVGGATELVVESPGYRQVLCEATPGMVDRFAATLRAQQPGMLEAFADEIRALRVAAAGAGPDQICLNQ